MDTTNQDIEARRKIDDDIAGEFPSPYLRALLMRLRIEMLSAARAFQGSLRDDFWKLVDELNEIRAEQRREDAQRSRVAAARTSSR